MPMPSQRACWGTEVRFVWTTASHLRKRESNRRWKVVRCACVCVLKEGQTPVCIFSLTSLRVRLEVWT